MERYTQFRDKATGISPFLPVLHTSVIGVGESGIGNFIKTVKLDVLFFIVLFITRIVLMSPLLMLSLIFGGLLGKNKVVLLNRIILFIGGLTSYELTIQNLKAKNLNKSFYPNKNDIFLVNFTGPLDYIFLTLISNDEFVILVPNLKGELQLMTSWRFLKLSLCGYEQLDYNNDIEISKLTNKIVYIFPEGTTSNGKAILPFLLTQSNFDKFIINLSKDKKTHKIKTLGIKLYPSTLVTPLNYSILRYIYKLFTTLSYSAKLRINIPNEVDSMDTNLIKLRSSFTNNGKFKLISLDLDVNAKIKFIESYVGRR